MCWFAFYINTLFQAHNLPRNLHITKDCDLTAWPTSILINFLSPHSLINLPINFRQYYITLYQTLTCTAIVNK